MSRSTPPWYSYPPNLTQFHIETESFGDDILTPRRRVEVGEVTVDTPTVAIDIKKTREHEAVRDDARGVNELHRSVNGKALTQSLRGDGDAIVTDLQRGYNKTRDDELTVAFVSYQPTTPISEAEAKYLCEEAIGPFSDIMTVPLMPELAQTVDADNGTSDPAFRAYVESVKTFLEVASRSAPDMPVMGVIPILGHDYTRELMDLYGREQIRAFCLDFNRTQITANAKVDIIRPMMSSIARRGIEESVLFYGINLAPGDRDESLGGRPAADFAGVGMGLDIIGGSHVSPRMPPSAFEDAEAESGGDTIIFRLFEKDEWMYHDIPLDELPEAFPEDSSLDAEHVVDRCRRSPKNTLNRLQKIVNAEQKALAAKELHPEIEDGDLIEHLSVKRGVTVSTTTSFQEVRGDFEEELKQSGLDDF